MHVREKFTGRDCERISQANTGTVPRDCPRLGWAEPAGDAGVRKFGQYQPLNRQAERYAKEGVPLSLSTLADQVGACCSVLAPIFERIEAHVFAAARLHGDDTTVPVLARGKTDIARSWVYVQRRPAVWRTGAAGSGVLRRSRRRPSARARPLARAAGARGTACASCACG